MKMKTSYMDSKAFEEYAYGKVPKNKKCSCCGSEMSLDEYISYGGRCFLC